MNEKIRSLLPVALVSAAAATTVVPESASAGIYWKLIKTTGDICTGDVTAENYEDTIQVNSWAWGLSRPVSIQPGQPVTSYSGSPDVAAISLTKSLDDSSACLYTKIIQGELIQDTTISVAVPGGGGGGLREYLKVDLTNALITSNQTSTGGDQPTESLTLVFEKICLTITTYDNTGVGTAGNPACWDNKLQIK